MHFTRHRPVEYYTMASCNCDEVEPFCIQVTTSVHVFQLVSVSGDYQDTHVDLHPLLFLEEVLLN
jgi:hypothetical protein